MELSDSEKRVAVSQYVAPPYRPGLMSVYGNSPIGSLDKVLERRQDHEQMLPGYIFICNGRTKADCFRYRVFGIPFGGKDIVESIKPGMKLFLYDFEKRLLYGVYEATISGRFDIEPEAFDRKYPAQVGFRIVKNCYPLPENTFKSALSENYQGTKFKQELAPHQVMLLLSLFRSFAAPELDLLAHRLASRPSAPRELSFEERFIAATQLRNASSGWDPLSARHAEPRLGSFMAHQPVPRASLLQHSYSRQDDYTTPARVSPSLSNLNQPYFPAESRQQRLLGEPSRSSIQDPQLKYLTILSNIRRYGTAPEPSASGNEYHPATLTEKDHFASPYSDNKYYPSAVSGNEHSSAPAANGSVYKSELDTSASQKEGEARQQHVFPAGTYYRPEASAVANTTVSIPSDVQAVSVTHSHTTETAGYHALVKGEAPQQAAGATGYTHQPQSVVGNYTTNSQPGSVEESTQSYAGTVSHPQQQYYAAMVHTTQPYAGGTSHIQQPHEIGYTQHPHASATGYAQHPHASASGYALQPHTSAAEYALQPHVAATGYTLQPHAAATGYSQQQPQATANGYTLQSHSAATEYGQQQPQAAATGYALQSHAQAVGYATQPHAQAVGSATQPHAQAVGYATQAHSQAVGYATQAHAQAVGYATQPHAQVAGYMPQYLAQAAGYTQQPVAQGSAPGATGTTDWAAASQAYAAAADWNAVNQSYYPHTADATTTYYQAS